MSIVDILVHVESRDSVDAVVRLAAAVARKVDGNLTALFVVPPFILPAYATFEMPVEVYQSQIKLAEKEADFVRSQVESVANDEGIEIEFETAHGDYGHTISRYARFADLLVLSKGTAASNVVSPQEVIINSNRLALVAPGADWSKEFPKRALVAFNGSQESVRTLHDAMPILARCEGVTMVSFDEENADSVKHKFDMDKLSAYLSHHGVEAEIITDTVKSQAVGDALLNHVKESKADFMVMGCYGHSRFREWVLGGATSEVLEHLPVPVFMSH